MSRKTLSRFALLLFCGSQIFAQLPDSRVLTLDLAQAIAQEALARCRAGGFKITVLVVDTLNYPRVLIRDDGAPASTTEASKMKAAAAMLYERPSGPPPNLPEGQPAPAPTIPGTSNGAGGVPIKFGNVTIGAVAVAGAPQAASDLACAMAGLAKVADRLK